jgi:hypothetical protein
VLTLVVRVARLFYSLDDFWDDDELDVDDPLASEAAGQCELGAMWRLAGIVTTVLMTAAMESGRRSGSRWRQPPEEITNRLLASGGTTKVTREQLGIRGCISDGFETRVSRNCRREHELVSDASTSRTQ